MNYSRDLEKIAAQIARDKKLLSSYRRKRGRTSDKEEGAQEVEKLKEGTASLEQVAAWLRYKIASAQF